MRSGRAIRSLWSRYVPHQARDPLGLLSRIIETRDPAALYALWTTGLGVCNQVLFHARAIREQQRRLGADRFWIVSYDEFCKDPEALLRRVSEEILGRPYVAPPGFTPPRNFVPSRRKRLPDEIFDRIRETLEQLGDARNAS